jgi:GNAT superfamily N-acetyltransferase
MHDAPYPNVKTATDVVLRTAADEDIAFIQGVFFETQRWIIEALFGWRGDDIEIAKFLDSYDSINTSIIVLHGENAGWLTVQRGEDIHLESLYLASTMQGRGIGTSLLRGLIDEATSTGKPLRLSTAKINPARRLYERLGFLDVTEDGYKVYMEWREPQ